MTIIGRIFAAIAISLALIGSAFAQGGPGGGPGPQPGPDPWVINGNSINPNGLEVITAPSTAAYSGFNIPPGTAPTSPANGDIWTTSGGVFARIGGTTYSLLSACSVCAVTNATNIFTAAQDVNLSGAALPSPQTGTVLQMSGVVSTNTRAELDSYAAVSVFSGTRTDGNPGSPTALIANDEIVAVNAFGYDGGGITGAWASIRCLAATSWSTTVHGTYCKLSVTPNTASATLNDVIVYYGDGGSVFGTATGGDKGTGTINAQGLYVNGTAVSVGGTPGGTSGQCQYNNAGAFGGITDCTSNGTTITLTGGTINGMAIGGTTRAAGAFTTVVASTTITAGTKFIVPITGTVNYTQTTTGAVAADNVNCLWQTGSTCLASYAGSSGSGLFLGTQSGPNNIGAYTANDNIGVGIENFNTCTTCTANILIGNLVYNSLVTSNSVTAIGHVVGEHACDGISGGIWIGSNESAPVASYVCANGIIDFGALMGSSGGGTGGPNDIVMAWGSTVFPNEGNGATPTGFNTCIQGACGNGLVDGGHNFFANGANVGYYSVHRSNSFIFGNWTTNEDTSGAWIMSDPTSGTLWGDYNYTNSGKWTFAGGVASKTCTINTANVAGGITITIVGGIVTATSGC